MLLPPKKIWLVFHNLVLEISEDWCIHFITIAQYFKTYIAISISCGGLFMRMQLAGDPSKLAFFLFQWHEIRDVRRQ